MRLLLASDLHYALPQFDWVESVAPEFEVVDLAGDLLDLTSAVPTEAQLPAVVRHLHRSASAPA
jgi:hypothetical protein